MNDPAPLIQSKLENARAVIVLSGEIDLSNADDLEVGLERAALGAEEVVIDLSAVEFIDSRGLRALKRTSTVLAGNGATLIFVAPPNCVARSVLDLTGMSGELGVRDSLESDGPAATE